LAILFLFDIVTLIVQIGMIYIIKAELPLYRRFQIGKHKERILWQTTGSTILMQDRQPFL
jgi:hypothetical protein